MAAFTLWRAVLLGLLVISPRVQAETPEGPYGGTAATVPGVIESEEFDYGGEGVGYSDSTFVNIQQDFRLNESVDVNAMSGGGYNVGKITAGEYLRYTVHVTEDVDQFYFNFAVASNETTGSFRIVSGGDGCDDYDTDLSGVVTVPNTGGWEDFDDLAVTGEVGAGLDAGEAYIWFCALTENFNIDYFSMATSPAPEGAYRGDPAVVPGLIEAEEFDNGGEGVGYSDSTAVNIQQDYRLDEAVDVNAMSTGGYNVGKITAGEYLRYTVVVKEDVDAFFFNFVVSSNETTGSFRIVSGGAGCHDYTTDLSGVVMVPNTGGWDYFEDVAVSGEGDGGLVVGSTYIWFCALTENFNIDSFTMTTTPAQEGAYGGVPATVPGLIEAEEFDYGGEGVGYSDSTIANIQQDFRLDEAVDINALEGGGYNVGKITAGEYLRYTVDVTADVDSFYFNFVLSSNETTGSFRIVSGGTGCDDYTTDLSGVVMVPNTGGWEDFDSVSVRGEGDGGLQPGLTYIWFCALTENFNIDSFTMTTSPAPEGAFEGVPATVPGRIEAEEFDTGGEGVGYSDSTTNNIPQEFRLDEAVDVHASAGGGYNVGNITSGEYLRYTVDVMANVDEFYFGFMVSSDEDTGSFRIVSGGTGCADFTTDLSGIVTVPNTGGLQQYEDVAVSGGGNGGLTAGTAYVWLCVLSETFSIDSFTMDTVPSLPFGGTPATVPGLIEAEEYDMGGQGVAYNDTTIENSGNAFRTDESVDVGSTDDGGYFVGWVKEGEFLHYTVDVSEDVDAFIFTFLVSAPVSSPGAFRIVTGGTDCDDFTTDLSGLVSVPGEGGSVYNEVITYDAEAGGLSAGVSVIRLCVVTEFFNIDSFSMTELMDR